MATSKLGIFGAVALLGITALATYQNHSRLQLQSENDALKVQLTELPRLAQDNQHLSNLMVQANSTQVRAHEQLEELSRLRVEVNKLRLEREESNLVAQAKLTDTATEQLKELSTLRSEIGNLSDEIGLLRGDIQEFFTTTAAGAAGTEDKSTSATSSSDDRTLSIRMISTHGEAFAEKLKSAANAQDGESFQDVFSRFLKSNGVDTTHVAGLVFDQRTGRIIARAPQASLDQIERLTLSLDQSQ